MAVYYKLTNEADLCSLGVPAFHYNPPIRVISEKNSNTEWFVSLKTFRNWTTRVLSSSETSVS